MNFNVAKEAAEIGRVADELQKKDSTLSRRDAVEQAFIKVKKEKENENN